MPETEAVIYDRERKIWSAPNYPYWNFIKQSVGEVFLQRMRTIPSEQVLEYYVDTEEQRTAGQIYSDSVAAAKCLTTWRLKKGHVLVVYSRNNPQTTPLIMGGLMIGAIVIVFETNLSSSDIDSTLKTLQPAAIFHERVYTRIITDSLNRSHLRSGPRTFTLETLQWSKIFSQVLRVDNLDLTHFESIKLTDPQSESAIYALTSGSTGAPKVVDISHSLLLHGVITWFCHTATPIPPTTDSVVFSFAPLRWISQIDMVLTSLLFGLKRVCAHGEPSGMYGRDIMRKGQVTHAFITPQTFQQILDTVEENDLETLSSLRVIQLGGETPSKDLRVLARKLCVNAQVYCCYGMTELSGVIATDEKINGGKLASGLQLQILDDNMHPCGPNKRGQFYIKAPVPFKPYLNIDNSSYYYPDGFFLNGDYGFVDNSGNLHVKSRYKDLVRTTDGIIVPSHIELPVSELPEVTMAYLVGYKEPTQRSESGALFVILKKEAEKMPREKVQDKICAVMRNVKISHFHHIGKINFVSNIPLTSCGKVDRTELRKIAESNY